MIINIIVGIVALIVGGFISYFVWDKALGAKLKKVLKDAETEGEVIRKQKELLAKEKFLQLKSEHEKYVNEKKYKIQQAEQRTGQKESSINQKLEELNRGKREVENLQSNLKLQLEKVEKKKEEFDRQRKEHLEKLEKISGLSSEEAKSQLVESLKAEAKTSAIAFINESLEEAKMTANKESKRIVIQTIQRVASEAAVENSVTVFHIENDEVKGRIIGREGRNIRALEAATGVEIIVDDTPESIVLSAFDPYRREVARLALHQLITDGRIHPARIE